MAQAKPIINIPIKKLNNTNITVEITSEFKKRVKIAKVLLRLAAWTLGASITFEANAKE